MTNVEIGVMDGTTLKVWTHASKIKVKIDGLNVSDMIVDVGSTLNAMSKRLLFKLGMRLSRSSSITVVMANKQNVI